MKQSKYIFITGASRGIGRATAISFAKRDYPIFFTYRSNLAAAKETQNHIQKLGVPCHIAPLELENLDSIRTAFNAFDKLNSPLACLVNNAGTTEYREGKDVLSLELDFFQKMVTANVTGTFACTQLAAQRMQDSGGSIVNVTSVAAFNGVGSNIAYAASKAAVENLTKSLARLLAPRIRVNSVAPGLTLTELTDSAPESYKQQHLAGTPLQRLAVPEDVANAVVAMAIDLTFATGQTLVIDGGRL